MRSASNSPSVTFEQQAYWQFHQRLPLSLPFPLIRSFQAYQGDLHQLIQEAL